MKGKETEENQAKKRKEREKKKQKKKAGRETSRWRECREGINSEILNNNGMHLNGFMWARIPK